MQCDIIFSFQYYSNRSQTYLISLIGSREEFWFLSILQIESYCWIHKRFSYTVIVENKKLYWKKLSVSDNWWRLYHMQKMTLKLIFVCLKLMTVVIMWISLTKLMLKLEGNGFLVDYCFNDENIRKYISQQL